MIEFFYEESEEPEVLEECVECGCELYEGDCAYSISSLVYCENCIDEYKFFLEGD